MVQQPFWVLATYKRVQAEFEDQETLDKGLERAKGEGNGDNKDLLTDVSKAVYVKIKLFFSRFPMYRKATFERQRMYMKSERLK